MIEFEMEVAQLEFVNEAISNGILHILYAKEFCGSIKKLYKKEYHQLLQGFCERYVEKNANIMLDFCGIKFEDADAKALAYNP
uniref:Uncharacterized protein n=1 Tax=Meloidogyne javanica TaxID=6303 RepID=A0A915MBK4_MELJA